MINFAVQMNPVDLDAIYEFSLTIKSGDRGCRIVALWFGDNVTSPYDIPDCVAWFSHYIYAPPFSTRSYDSMSDHEREIEKNNFLQEVMNDLLPHNDPKEFHMKHCLGWLPEDEFNRKLAIYLLNENPKLELRKKCENGDIISRDGHVLNDYNNVQRIDRGTDGEFVVTPRINISKDSFL